MILRGAEPLSESPQIALMVKLAYLGRSIYHTKTDRKNRDRRAISFFAPVV